jgi:predicted Zn finger-like uncharacterized protein
MQTILTQCPRCQTSFKVSDKQLAIASGMVRCGSCLDVFSAPDNRITIKQPVSAVLSPEHFPDDIHESAGNIQEQTPPAAATSYSSDTKPYYEGPSSAAGSASFEPGHEVPPNRDAGKVMDTGAASSDAPLEVPASADDEVEFVLDFDDDMPLGDMMLDDAVQDSLDDGVLDVSIHDAGNRSENVADAHSESSDEHTLYEQTAESEAAEIEYVHETAHEAQHAVSQPESRSSTPDNSTGYEENPASEANAGNDADNAFPEVDGSSGPLQEIVSELQENADTIQNFGQSGQTHEESDQIIAFAAQQPNAEPGEQMPAITVDLQRPDYDDLGHSSGAEQPASDQSADSALPGGLHVTAAVPVETTAANDAAATELEALPEAGVETIPADITAEPREIFAHRLSTDSDELRTFDPQDAFSADNFSEGDEIHLPGFSALSSAELDENELGAPASSKPHSHRDKEELRQYLAALEDADALEPLSPAIVDSIEIDPLTFEVGHVFRKYVTTFGWFMLSAGLLGTLVLQFVAHNLEFMQSSPSYSRYVPLFCRVLDCPEPRKAAAIESLRYQDLLVRSHPSVPDALEVSFIFRNDASVPQPFPLVELRFMDSSRRLMAHRLLKPEEYLPIELAALDEMPASSSVQVMLEMVDPGSDAVNYEITFRDPAENLIGPAAPAP